MKRFFKFIIGLLAVCITLVAVGFILLITLVNSKTVQTHLTAMLKKQTDANLQIHVDMHWSFYPHFGLALNDVEFLDDKTNQSIGKLGRLTVQMELYPLVHQKLIMHKLVIDKLQMNIDESHFSKGKWKYAKSEEKSVSAQKHKEKPLAKPEEKAKKEFEFDIDTIAITHSNITYTTDKNKRYVLSNANFRLRKLNALDGNFSLQFPNESTAMQVNFKTDIMFDKINNKIQLPDFQISAQGGPVDNAALSGTVLLADQEIKLSPFHLELNKLKTNGTLLIQLDKEHGVRANLTADQLTHKNITLQNVITAIKLQDKKIILSPFKASVFGGSTQGTLLLDLTTKTPRYLIKQSLKKIDFQQLLQAFHQRDRITGVGNIDATLTMSGKKPNEMINSLTGRINTNIGNGVIHGIDINYQIANAAAKLQKSSPSRQDTKQSRFKSLTASSIIANGVLSNSDLKILGDEYRVAGDGSVSFASKSLHYKLQVRTLNPTPMKLPFGSLDLSEYDIPIVVKGPFSDLTITTDVGDIIKMAIKKQVEKQILKKAGKSLQEKAKEQLDKTINTKDLKDKIKNILPF